MDQLRERQIDTVRYLDGVFAELYDMVPKDTYVIVTADHGELFRRARLLRTRTDHAREVLRGALPRGQDPLRETPKNTC